MDRPPKTRGASFALAFAPPAIIPAEKSFYYSFYATSLQCARKDERHRPIDGGGEGFHGVKLVSLGR